MAKLKSDKLYVIKSILVGPWGSSHIDHDTLYTVKREAEKAAREMQKLAKQNITNACKHEVITLDDAISSLEEEAYNRGENES